MRNELLRERDEICARIKDEGRKATEDEIDRMAEILTAVGKSW